MQEEFVKTLDSLYEQALDGNHALVFGDASHLNETIAPSKVICIKGTNCPGFPSQKRGGRTSVIGALDAVSNKLAHFITRENVNKETFSLFLIELRKKYPDKEKIFLVLDNATYQKNKVVRERASMLGIELVFLPPYCPNLNLIERLWKYMKKKISSFWVDQKKSDIYLRVSDFCSKFVKGLFKKETRNLFNFKFQII